jgi:KaiC/GvpD/RAD55 family RecA-like ATPase
MSTMRFVAADYYERGWMPIPLRAQGTPDDLKKPLVNWREFQHDRPPSHEVEGLFEGDTNIAVITGRVSGLVVIDFDGKVDDPVAFLTGASLPASCPIAVTGGGGFHCYYRHPGGTVHNGVRLAEIDGIKIDVRGDGGYVVAPPSMHGSGNRYYWLQEGEPPLLPECYRQLLERAPGAQAAPAKTRFEDFFGDEAERILRGVGQGQRNDAAARVAGYALKVTRGDEQAAATILRLWNAQNTPPLDDEELAATLNSIIRRDRSHGDRHKEQDAPLAEGDVLDGRAWAKAVYNVPPRRGIPAPALPTIDEVGGIVPGDLVLLAGRPGMGKSTCAWGVAIDVAIRQKQPTVLFSSEMTAVDVARWIGAKLHKTPPSHLSSDQWTQTLRAIANSPISICTRGRITSNTITEYVAARPDTKLVIVDHAQRISFEGDNKNLGLERIAVGLKNLAKDHGCTVLLLSQMNRASVYDRSVRPELPALRDSGALEQEADAVIFIWTDHDDLTAQELPVRFYLAKNRHGSIVEKPALFNKPLKSFVPEDQRDQIAQLAIEAEYKRRQHALLAGEDQ